ncbi:MAG: S26 family signal peptidase [Clostridia bacterium]|nr:S26 family signal peptidase [Clostridia bacterium]
MNKAKVKKIINIAANVLLYIFLAVCIFSVIVTLVSRNNSDGATEIFGYQMRVVTSDSMAECEHTDVSAYEIGDIPIRSMVFIETVPEDPAEAQDWYGELKVGDVLTFRYVYTSQVTITHRITSITEKETGGYVIKLAGDNRNSESSQLDQIIDTSLTNSPNYVIGKVTAQAYIFGVIMSFLMTPLGMVIAIIVPCLLIILLEVFKIFSVFNAEKKELRKKENEEKERELEELRRKLAELEDNKGNEKVSDTVGENSADKADNRENDEK